MKTAPSKKNPPSAINPAALEVWDHVCHRFADEIYQSKNLTEQWACAKRRFERACELREIAPYNKIEAWASALERIARGL